MDNTTVGSKVVLYEKFLGKPVSLKYLFSISIPFSIALFAFFEYPEKFPHTTYPLPTIPTDIQLFAGVFFFLLISLRKPFLFLRHPRSTDWAYISGLTYKQRQDISLQFIRRRLVEFSVFSISFLSVRILLQLVVFKKLVFIQLALVDISLFVILCCLYFLGAGLVRLIQPSKREYFNQKQIFRKRQTKGSQFIFLRMAQYLSGLAKGQIHTVVMRMLLYIIRNDFWGAFFIQIAGIAICTVIALILPAKVEMMVRVALLIAPVIIINEYRDVIITSVLKANSCAYYYFTYKDHFFASLYLFSMQMLPYVAIFAIRQVVYYKHIDIAGIVNFYISAVVIVLLAVSFIRITVGKGVGTSAVTLIAAVILSTLIPYVGIALSSSLIILYYFTDIRTIKV